MKDQVHFPAIVMLLDAVMLNNTVIDFNKNFEKILQRPLPAMDVAQFVVNLALDSGVTTHRHDIQVIWVYDDSIHRLRHCTPSVLESELNGVAFQDPLGEFSFASLSPNGITTRESLFLDMLTIIGDSDEVQQIIVVPSESDIRESAIATLCQIKNKKITLFSMEKPEKETGFAWQMLAYPIMQALGIKGEELD